MLAMAAASWALLPCWAISPGLSSSPAAPAPPPAYSNSSCPGRPNPPFSGAEPLSVAPLLIAARSPAPPPLGTGLLRIASGLSMLLGRVYCSRRSANSAEVWSHGIAPVSIKSLRTLSAASESWGRASAEGEGRESGGGDMAPIRLSRSDSCIIECRRSEGPGRPAQSRNMVSRLPRGRVEAGGWATPSPRAGVKGWRLPLLSLLGPEGAEVGKDRPRRSCSWLTGDAASSQGRRVQSLSQGRNSPSELVGASKQSEDNTKQPQSNEVQVNPARQTSRTVARSWRKFFLPVRP